MVKLSPSYSTQNNRLNTPGSDRHGTFDRSFDFAKFQNLEEVEFSVHRTSEGLLWITTTLSTLKPATSPRLCLIRLKFGGSPRLLSNDLLLFNDEATRIKAEFAGTIDLRVKGYPASF